MKMLQFILSFISGFFDSAFLVLSNNIGAITIDTVQALTTKGIEAAGGVRDAVFENHSYLKRLRAKQGVYHGSKMTFPFIFDATGNGSYYNGAETLSLDLYDPITELSFNIINLQETLIFPAWRLADDLQRRPGSTNKSRGKICHD